MQLLFTWTETWMRWKANTWADQLVSLFKLMLVNNKILGRVLKEWQHFPWQEEQFPPLRFQVHCRQHSGSTASFPIVWLVPESKDSNQCTLSVKPMNQRKTFTLNKSILCSALAKCNWIFLDRMRVNFSSGTSFLIKADIILTFHERSWAMPFWIISFKAGVP